MNHPPTDEQAHNLRIRITEELLKQGFKPLRAAQAANIFVENLRYLEANGVSFPN